MPSFDDILKSAGLDHRGYDHEQLGRFVGVSGPWRLSVTVDFPFQADVPIAFEIDPDTPQQEMLNPRRKTGLNSIRPFTLMTIGQLLEDIRDRYLTEFRECIAYVKQNGMEAMCETAYRDEDGVLAREGILSLPMRLDVVGVADGEAKDTIRVDSDSMLSFEPIDFEWSGGLPTRLAPFHWDGCHVRAIGIRKAADWSHLCGWFDQWFDGEDARRPDGDGLCGVIHFLFDPKQEGAATTFEVDFGSAPVEAFEEFLDALRDSGATEIEIGYDHDG